MPAPLFQDLRRRFRRYIETGPSRREATRRLLISPATGLRLARRVRRGEPIAAQKCGRPPGWGKLGARKALLIGLVEQDVEDALAEAEAVHVHESRLSRALRRMGCRFKKSLVADEGRRPDVARARRDWTRPSPTGWSLSMKPRRRRT